LIHLRNNLFITQKSVRSRLSSEIDSSDKLTLIAGSVVLSDNPSQQLKYWRKRFGVKQADLARKMNITPSVLSDYEKGRRPSPGVNFIKRYLISLYELGKSNGHADAGVVPTPVANLHINQP
jgi:predicted transcriptional regulator